MNYRLKCLFRVLMAVWSPVLIVACSASTAPIPSMPAPLASSTTEVIASRAPTAAPAPVTKEAMPPFPPCKGMQSLSDPVNFEWPNLNEHRQEFSRSQWTYFACEQPAPEVAASYRQQLPEPPYSLDETNWLERQEGTLGVYFSQKGAWDYIWFIPRPNDPQKSYLIIAETFAYVEC